MAGFYGRTVNSIRESLCGCENCNYNCDYWIKNKNMKTTEQVNKEFDERFIHPFGAKTLRIFTIPEITDDAKFWALENITSDILNYIHQTRTSDRTATLKEIEEFVKFSILDPDFEYKKEYYKGHNEFKEHLLAFLTTLQL